MYKPGEIFAEDREMVNTGIRKPNFITASLVVLLGSFLQPILITKHFFFVDFLLLPLVIPSRIQRAQCSVVGRVRWEVKCFCGSSINSSSWILPKFFEGLRDSEPHPPLVPVSNLVFPSPGLGFAIFRSPWR